MPTIAVTCRSCGNDFEPSDDDIRTGHWHTCPACRGDPDPQVSSDLAPGPEGVQGQMRGRKHIETESRP